MTDGQQPDQTEGPDEEFRPKPGQPTLPFRAIQPPPSATGTGQGSGYGYPRQDPPGAAAAQPDQGAGYGYPQGRPGQPAGYGYPQGSPGQSGYGYPAGRPSDPSGYGYPGQDPAEGGRAAGPAWAPPSTPLADGAQPGGQPDWSALAERGEREGKRRRWLMIGGGSLAVVVLAGIVATAVVVSGHHGKPAASATGQPSPSFSDVTPPPAPDPLSVLSDPAKDTAPLTTASLFPGTSLTFGSRHYSQAAVSSTDACTAAATGGLGGVLEREGCEKLLRATYYGDGIAVTVGVAEFPTAADAKAAKEDAVPYVLPLSGGAVGGFCHSTSCQASANAVGRYAYFTIAGRMNGAPVTADDPATAQAATDVADFAFDSIVQRGRDEAATEPAG